MSTFIKIASRVEAAVAAYTSVRDFADKEKWKVEFQKELVSAPIFMLFNCSTFALEKGYS
jgi:hypothetical protein